MRKIIIIRPSFKYIYIYIDIILHQCKLMVEDLFIGSFLYPPDSD